MIGHWVATLALGQTLLFGTPDFIVPVVTLAVDIVVLQIRKQKIENQKSIVLPGEPLTCLDTHRRDRKMIAY